jgi:uncharacterized protein (DUF2336 family)
MLLTEREIRQLIYNILLEGAREDADALRALLTDTPEALSQFEPLSMKPKWVNWLADRYVRNKYPANDTLKDALPIVVKFAAADAAISQKYGSNPQFAASVDTSFPPSERKWNNPADAAAMSTTDMDTLLTLHKRPKDKLGINREDTSWKNDEVGTFGPWKLYFPTNQQNSINIAGVDPVTHKPYTDWCTARTSSENLFNNYAAHGTMLFYAINAEAPPQNPKSRISLGFAEGELDVSGEYGGITVDGANTGLASSGLKRIFGGYYASIIARAKEVIAKHGGEHPVKADIAAAAKDPVKFNSILRGLSDDQAGNIASEVFMQAKVSPEVVAVAIRHKSPVVRECVASLDYIPQELVIRLAEDPDASVRIATVRRKKLPLDFVVKLAGDADAGVRMEVARRKDLPTSVAVKLARDPDAHVRATIMGREDLPPDLVVKLAEDPDARIRMYAARSEVLPPDLVVKLAEDPDAGVRMYFATRQDLPTSIAVKLAGDSDARVREVLARRSVLPAVIVAKLAEDPDTRVRSRVARRKDLTAPLANKLAEDSDDFVRAEAASSEELSPDLVVKLAGDSDSVVREHVASRKDLTVPLAIKLAEDPNEYVRERIARSEVLPDSLVIKLAVDPSRRVQMAVAQRENLSQAVKDAINAARERIEESRHLAHRILREIKRRGHVAN